MTWLQFVVEMTKALAWPVAAVAIVVILRDHLSALFDRIAELTLPGGYKIGFQSSLRKSGNAVTKLDHRSGAENSKGNLAFRDLHTNYASSGIGPLDQMIPAFAELERLLLEVGPIIEKPNLRVPRDVAAELVRQRLVSTAFQEAFDNLRKARNAAVHIPERQITPVEAVEFISQAKILTSYLEALIEQKGKRG